jgi:hypothetical protein
MPGARCTRSLVCAIGSKYAHEYSQRATGNHPTFPHAMVYGLYVLSPVIGFLVTVACQRFANLMPASRHQDHTTSPSAHAPVVCSAFRVHRIPPRVRDDRASAPLSGRDGEDILLIWVRRQAVFLKFRNFWAPERDGFDVNRRRAKPRPSRPKGPTRKQPASF